MKQRTKTKLEEKIKQQQQAEPWLFRHGDKKVKKKKSRMDIIGQNGNTGEHYEEIEEAMPNGRWNWWDRGEDKDLTEEIWKVRELEEAARKKFNYYDAKAALAEEGE